MDLCGLLTLSLCKKYFQESEHQVQGFLVLKVNTGELKDLFIFQSNTSFFGKSIQLQRRTYICSILRLGENNHKPYLQKLTYENAMFPNGQCVL